MEAVAGQRADEVLTPLEQPGMQRGGVLDLVLLDVVEERPSVDVEAPIGHDAVAEHRVLDGWSTETNS